MCVCVWAGVRGIRASREVFLLLFLEFVNMFVLHGKSHCWSKLNAEFSLFYSFSSLSLFFFFVFVCRKRKPQNSYLTPPGMVLICG